MKRIQHALPQLGFRADEVLHIFEKPSDLIGDREVTKLEDEHERIGEPCIARRFDLALSTVVATDKIYNILSAVDDALGVRLAYVPMGVCWNTGVQAMSAVVREITGLLEFVPGTAWSTWAWSGLPFSTGTCTMAMAPSIAFIPQTRFSICQPMPFPIILVPGA